jgi:hypothetical protein
MNEEKSYGDVAYEAFHANDRDFDIVAKAVISEFLRRNGEPFLYLDPETGDTCGNRNEVYHFPLFAAPQGDNKLQPHSQQLHKRSTSEPSGD